MLTTAVVLDGYATACAPLFEPFTFERIGGVRSVVGFARLSQHAAVDHAATN